MSDPQFKATMTIPKNGNNLWTDIMQNPSNYPLPQGVTEDQYIVASTARFSDGVFVVGGVAVGPKEQNFNYAYFMVFDKNYSQIGGWPIDTSDWEDFQVREIQFSINPKDGDGNYLLSIVEES